jgi:uroporphyrinogen-III decarboxylase
VELVFHPNWWYRNYGIRFDRPFYFDRERRIHDDVIMRRTLYERFGELGMGEPDPQPRPVVGSMHIAGGFVVPAVLGADVVFRDDQAPWPRPVEMPDAQIMALESPDIEATSPMREFIADMDLLEAEYGALLGDYDTDGILNTALCLRGQRLFLDFRQNPELVHHLFAVIAETQVRVASYVRGRTGSCAIATNRIVERIDARTYLHSNCSVQMISPGDYERFVLPYERRLAERLQPYGIHHCGHNMHLFAGRYAQTPASLFDIGWGSDVAACREALPSCFFSLRLSPVRMLQCTPDEIAADTETLLSRAGPVDQTALCCINMDYGTPDTNIRAMYEVVQRYRGRASEGTIET